MGRYTKREYQLGEWFLGQRSDSPAWYMCKLEGRAVKRFSLGTTDFEQAKQKLNEWWAEQFRLETVEKPPQEVKLADVILDYWNNQGSKLRSAQTVKIMLRYWNEWWGDCTVADVRNPNKQDDFRAHLSAKGLNNTSVARCLEIGRAAIRRAWKRGNISSFPHVEVPLIRETQPKGRPLTVEEAGKLIGGTNEKHIQLFILLMLGTAARSEPIIKLEWKQIDFEAGLIHLNPEGRVQTSKRRPVVKLPDVLRSVLEPMDKTTGRVLIFRGRKINGIVTGWDKMVGRSGLTGNVTAYSLRHTMARWMRMKSVPMEQIAGQLGHSMPSFAMSERYAPHDPSYLNEARAAIDEFLALVRPAAHTLSSSLPAPEKSQEETAA